MPRRVLLILLLFLSWSTLSWAQPAQLINGNRTHAGATNYGVTTGTGSAYLLTLNAAIPGYVNGSCYLMQAHVANTGPATLNVNSRGARTLKKKVGTTFVDLEVDDIVAGQLVEACTDGTVMQTTLGSGTGAGGASDFSELTGTASDAQIPHLNTLSTGLTPSRCVETNATTGLLTVAAGPCGAAAGFVDVSGTPTVDQLAVFTDANTVQGVSTVSDAQVPHLNTLSTGLTPSRCVETNATTGLLTVAAGPCGAAAGFVDVSGTPVAGQLAIFTDSNTLQGTNTLDVNYAASHVSTSGTISTGTEYVTTGAATVTRTLPAAASGTSTKRFYVIKEDAGAGSVSIPPAGGNTIAFAGGTGTLTITQQWTGWVLHEVSATGWYAEPIGGGSGDALTSQPLSQFAPTTSAQLAGVLTDENGATGGFVRAGGNVATATALAANGANCVLAGTFPNGVDAAGGAENCVTLSAVNPQTATYPVVAADFDSYRTIAVASGTFTITLLGTAPTAGKYLRILNYGSGVVTLARNGLTINGGTMDVTLPAGSATDASVAFVQSTGTAYIAALSMSEAGRNAAAGTLTNKVIDLAPGSFNTLTGTKAQFDTALQGADFATLTGSEDLSGKRIAPRYLELSAASGTVAAPIATGAGGDIYYRYGITGSLIIPVPTGSPNNGQKFLFILQSDSVQPVTFTPGAGGFSGDANQAVPNTTTGDVGGNNVYDHFTFIYNSHADRYVYVGGSRATSPCPVSAGCTGLSSGTSGGVPYFASTTTMASSAALTLDLPMFGGGAGAAPKVGTRSGNTTEVATSTGTKTTNRQLAWDANGNVVASASAIGGGSTIGTVQLWPGQVVLPDGTTDNGFATSKVAKSTGTPPTNAPNLHFMELVFADDVARHAFFCFVVPQDYLSGGIMYINWKRDTGTGAANVVHKGALAAVTPGASEIPTTKALSAVVTTTTAAGTTADALVQTTIALNMDNAAPRDSACAMYGRDGTAGTDTLDGVTIEVLSIWLEYSR